MWPGCSALRWLRFGFMGLGCLLRRPCRAGPVSTSPLREGRANIAESYVSVEGNEAWLINANIPIYAPAAQFNHLPTRNRKLLLKRRQVNALIGETQRKGRTVVPLRMYFNGRGKVKLLVGVAKGKKAVDKRETQKKRDWQRDKARIMRDRG